MYITRHTSPVLFDNSSSSRFNFTVDWLSFSYLASSDNPFDDPVLSEILLITLFLVVVSILSSSLILLLVVLFFLILLKIPIV